MLNFILYLFGLFHWLFFFNWGNLKFNIYDWPKEFKYYTVLKEFVSTGNIPYHISEPFQGTNRFLALPETLISPQLLLIKFLSVAQFVIFNTLLLYSISFVGLLLIKRKYKLTLLPFLVLYILFNFNGYITSHIAAGHSMWSGYFLLPLFCLFIMDLVDGQRQTKSFVKLTLILLAILLQGAFHIFVWCAVFMALLAIFNRKLAKPLVYSIIACFFLGAFRFIPGMLTFYNKGFPFVFISGYPGVLDVISALTVVKTHHFFPYAVKIGWWEVNAYISVIGLFIILYFGVYMRLHKDKADSNFKYKVLNPPILIIFLLSFTFFFEFFSKLPFPFLNSQRIACRFIILPMVFIFILATLRLNNFILQVDKKRVFKILLSILVVIMFILVLRHSYIWRISNLESAFPDKISDLNISIIYLSDPGYINSVKMSIKASLLSAAVFISWIIFAFKKGKFN